MITLNDYLYSGDTLLRILKKYIRDLRTWNCRCNVIRDHHKIAGMEGWIGASGRIGEKKFFCPKKPHQTCRRQQTV